MGGSENNETRRLNKRASSSPAMVRLNGRETGGRGTGTGTGRSGGGDGIAGRRRCHHSRSVAVEVWWQTETLCTGVERCSSLRVGRRLMGGQQAP